MRCALVAAAGAGLLVSGCNHTAVNETTLPNNQRVAIISNYGDGFTPPTEVMLVEATPGRYVAVETTHGAAPVTTVLAGTGAVVALAARRGL